MGLMRTLLLGDLGQHLDIADNEKAIRTLREKQRDGATELERKASEIAKLRQELGRQALAIQCLTRFLIDRGLVNAEELAAFADALDAEDGVRDGQITAARPAHPPLVAIPKGIYRKAGSRAGT
jgi:hypothetical protein